MFYQNQNDLNRLDFLIKYSCKLNSLSQRFSTWGTRTPGGTRDTQGGTQNFKISNFLIFFSLGVLDYQKVENRWDSKQIWISISKVNKGKFKFSNFSSMLFCPNKQTVSTHKKLKKKHIPKSF
jgi:hypothetical protein